MPRERAWLCWDDLVSERKPYPSDLPDERWALIEPVITAWKAAHPSVSGHQGGYAMREIVNAILCQGRTGCQWDYLPHDLPPRSAVYYYFARWRDDGTGQAGCDLLRWQAREKRGRLPVRSYLSMMTARPVTLSDQTYVEWTSRFDCDEADEDKVTAAVRDGVLVPGLKALEQRFGPAR